MSQNDTFTLIIMVCLRKKQTTPINDQTNYAKDEKKNKTKEKPLTLTNKRCSGLSMHLIRCCCRSIFKTLTIFFVDPRTSRKCIVCNSFFFFLLLFHNRIALKFCCIFFHYYVKFSHTVIENEKPTKTCDKSCSRAKWSWM